MKQEHDSVSEFLREYPGLSRAPTRGSEIILRGTFEFSAQHPKGERIDDSYELEIVIPGNFPKRSPTVTEVAPQHFRKIPRNADHHVNRDGTLCLGSPLRLLHEINKEPTLNGFVKRCLIPYLYAISLKAKRRGPLIFNELAHGKDGVLADYLDIFKVDSPQQVIRALELIGMKKRIANKKPCPCNCGKRLGRCSFRFKVNNIRKMSSRSWFKGHARNLDAD